MAPVASNSAIDTGQYTTLTVNAPTTGTSPYTYVWYSGTSPTCTSDTSTGFTGLSHTFTPSSSTYYCVQETDSASTNAIVYTSTTQVTVNPALVASPAPTASNAIIDNGQYATLTVAAPTTGTSPYTYVWYSGTSPTCTSDTSTGLTGLSQTFTPSSSTYYCVQETDSMNSVVYTSTTQVQVNSALVASAAPIASNTVINNGQPTTLTINAPTTGTSPYTYVWYSGTSPTCTSDTSTGFTGLSHTFTPSSSTYYCVKETDSASTNEIVYTSTTQVTVNPTFVASPAPTAYNSVIDLGQSTTLTANAPTTGTSPYTYVWYSGTSPTCTSDSATAFTSLSQTFTPSSSTYYCVKETDNTGNVVYTGTTQVTVNPALVASPAPTASNSLVDNGNPTTLTVNAPTTGSTPYTYIWYSGTSPTCTSDTATAFTSLSQTFTPSSSTYYCVKETDNTGNVVYTGTTQVSVNPTFVASPAPTASNTVIDNGQSSTLTVNAPTTGTSPYTYVWYSGTSPTCTSDTATAFTSLSQTFTPSSSTYYCVKETDNTGNVVYTGTTQVIVNPALVASPAPTASNSIVDNGNPTTLTVTAPTTGTSPYTYVWYSGTSPTCTSDTATAFTGLSQIFTPSSSTYYCVQETDATNSIVYTGTTQVQVNTALSASPAPTAYNAMIDLGQSSTLTVNAPTTGTSPYTYVWYSGTSPTCTSDTATAFTSLSQTFTPSSSTYYCVQETDNTGNVVYTGTTQVTVNPALVASPAPTTSNSVINRGQPTTLTVNAPTTGTSPYTYVWYSGTSPTCTGDTSTGMTLTSNTFYPTVNPTYYCVQETDNTGNVVYTPTTSITVNPALTAPVISATPTSVGSGGASNLSATAPLSDGTSPYVCQWLQESPNASSYNTLGSSFSCDTSSLPTISTGNLPIDGTWNFEIQVTDNTLATATSSLVSVGVNVITTSTTTIAAITCPFNLALSTSSQFYLLPPSILFNYTASTTGSCAPSAPFVGKLDLFRNGSVSVYETVPVAVPQLQLGKTSGTINLNSANLTSGTYVAQFRLSTANNQNSSSTSFYILPPAKLLITNFTVEPSNVTQGSGLSLVQDISNLGGLSSTNTTLNIAVSGPNNFYDSIHQNLGAIGTGNIQTVIQQLVGDSDIAGLYTITESVSFSSNLTVGSVTYSSGVLMSNTQIGSYVVVYTKSTARNATQNYTQQLPVPPSSIGAMAISSAPVYSRVLIGNTTTSYLGLTNIKNATVAVKLTTPNVPYGVLISSIKSFFVNGGTTEYVQFVFTPYLNATPGIYNFPIHISVDDSGTIVNGTVHSIFDIEKKNNAVVNYDTEAQTSNYGKNLTVSINLHNPTNLVINNTVMFVKFPSFAAPITGISLAGAQANETSYRGETSLEWLMPFIQPHHSTQLGYSVSNITDLPLLLQPFTDITSTAGSAAPTFTLMSVAPNNVTSGKNIILTVIGLYQGMYQPGMTLQLSPTSDLAVKVETPIQLVYNVMQSQIISTAFEIVPSAVGNTTLKIALKGMNINQTGYFPISVSPTSTTVTRFVSIARKNISLILAVVLIVALSIIALHVATEEMPKSIIIETGTEATFNIEMRKQKYDHVFELLSKRAAEKETKMRLKGVPTNWGIFTPLNKRNVRIINDSGRLTIYTRGAVANKLKTYMKSNKLPFVELKVD